MTIKPSDISSLVELFAASHWDELHVEIDGLHLFLSTDPNARLASSVPLPSTTPVTTEAQARSVTREPPVTFAAQGAQSSVPAGGAPVAVPANWVAVTAPNLGTFYRAPKPGAAPFVEEGQTVEAGRELCLIEVMKLFTSVKAEVAGTVRRVCVKDAQLVEFGQTLLYIERA